MELKKEDLVQWLKLSSVKGIGSSRMLKLLSIFGNVNDIYKASIESLFSTRIFNKSMIDEYDSIKKKDSRYFEYIIDECGNHKIKIIPFYSKEYPSKLKAMPDSPLTLFAWGDIELLKTKKVAIVGSRESSEEAKKWTFENAKKISNKGITIVSGGAKGIDYSAHYGALSSNGKTIAIVGSGLFKLYPEEHRELFNEIKHRGLLLSEHPPEYVGSRISLLRRNRIISGISNCLLLVTSSTEGGSVTQLRIANTQRIPIFCPSISLNLLPNAGIKEAISKYHVTEITSIEPITKEVNKPSLFSYI